MPGWEDLARDVGLPEQARAEITDFLVLATERGTHISGQVHYEMQMIAKGVAMQQAGMLPWNHDIESLIVKCEEQLELEGLLKGY